MAWRAGRKRPASRFTPVLPAPPNSCSTIAVRVRVITGDMGVLKDGTQAPISSRAWAARQVRAVCRGCRGHLGKELEARFNLLRDGVDPQTTTASASRSCGRSRGPAHPGPGGAHRLLRWTPPLTAAAAIAEDNLVAVGFVVGLNCNPLPVALRGIPSATKFTRSASSSNAASSPGLRRPCHRRRWPAEPAKLVLPG